MNASTSPPHEPVSVSLADLRANTVHFSTLEAAFGPSSLGIILVGDLPAQFHVLRTKLLQYASYLAHLPAAELDKVTCPRAKYLTGWSHGVETLKSGRPDKYKGSYYANCDFYRPSHPPAHTIPAHPPSPSPDDFPEYLTPNIWPADDLLPGFQQSFEGLCALVIDVAVLVARACDRYAEAEIEGYETGYLERVVRTSRTTKARLLHYFPAEDGHQGAENEAKVGRKGTGEQVEGYGDDDWCATHVDHGCLTGLTSALYVDESRPPPALTPLSTAVDRLPPLNVLPASPDPSAGLYIRSRTGDVSKVAIPTDCLGFQTGEALELITRGRFKAVPHYVRGIRKEGATVARNTLAVFTQPNLNEVVDTRVGLTFGEFARGVVKRGTLG